MSKFNIGDKVISKDGSCCGKIGVVVGMDTREDVTGKYLVKFESLGAYEGWGYKLFSNSTDYIVEPYEGYATWLDDIEKVEDECKEYDMSIEKMMKKVMKTGLIERYFICTVTATTYDIYTYFNFNGKSFCYLMRDVSIEEVPYNTLLNTITEGVHKTINDMVLSVDKSVDKTLRRMRL